MGKRESSVTANMMHCIWTEIHAFLSRGPEGHLKAILSNQNIHDSIRWHHDNILRKGSKLISILLNDKYDEEVMERAFGLYVSISDSWYWFKVDWSMVDGAEKENQPRRGKRSRQSADYRERTCWIFYQCSEAFCKALVKMGRLTASERDGYLRAVRMDM